VDFDGDGHLDILSGCYWSSFEDDDAKGNPQAGYIMMYKGKGTLSFDDAKPVCDENSNPLTNVKLSQDKIENYDSDKIVWQNICTRQHLVDYDGDGDLDLVNGCMEKEFFLHENKADSADAPPVFDGVGKELSIKAPDNHSDPHLADFDGDGDLDLLTGGSHGGVYISVNDGTREQPKWRAFVRLVDAVDSVAILGKTEADAAPDRASRVWTYDFNHDGKLDLLVGDTTEVVEPLPGESTDDFIKAKADYVAKYNSLTKRFENTPPKDEEAYEELKLESWTFHDTRVELFDIRSTGHVWLYLQK